MRFEVSSVGDKIVMKNSITTANECIDPAIRQRHSCFQILMARRFQIVHLSQRAFVGLAI